MKKTTQRNSQAFPFSRPPEGAKDTEEFRKRKELESIVEFLRRQIDELRAQSTPDATILSRIGTLEQVFARLQNGVIFFNQINQLPTTLAGYGITDAVLKTLNIIAGTGLNGGGPLTGDVTLNLSTPIDISFIPDLSSLYGSGSSTGRWEPMTNGDSTSPEVLFEDGDIVMDFIP